MCILSFTYRVGQRVNKINMFCLPLGHLSCFNLLIVFVRFELSSTESGLISSCYDIAGSLTVLFVTYVGGHGHKPLWIGWGIFLVGLSGIVFSLPHFTASPYTFVDMANLCQNATLETCAISSLKDFR